MQLLSQAEAALLRNWRVVALYLAGNVAIIAAHGYVMDGLGELKGPKALGAVLTTLSADILLVVLIATFQAVAFAAIGREMDRPMWKCDGWRESLRRFFSYWFILNLISITISRLPMSVPEAMQSDVMAAMEFFRLGLIIFAVPLGACIMYGGGLHWKELPDFLAPFFQLFHMAVVSVFLGFLQFFIIVSVSISVPTDLLKQPWFWSLVNVPLVLLECLAFAVMWLVCMHYRDIDAESGGDDFDI